MMPEGIGKVGFLTSIIEYVILFVNLGIPMYGVREIARVRDDKQLRDKTTLEILLLHLSLSVIGYLVVLLLCLFVPQINSEISLFVVLSSSILLNAIGCEWFYQGIENFLYVTIRGITVKVLSVIFLFTCVKAKDDILLYGLFTVIGVYGGHIFNFLKLRNYICWESIHFNTLNPFKQFKGSLGSFTFSVISVAYILLNPTILGFMRNMEEVGYFTASTKLMVWGVRITSCLGVVMMPHISNVLANKQMDEFKLLSQKAYDFVVLISVPLVVLLFFLSEPAVLLLCGEYFLPAVATTKIIAPVVFCTGLAGVMGYQILFPMGHLNIVIKSALIGFVVDLFLCVLLIPIYTFNGTALAYLMAELCTMISIMWLSRHLLPLKLLTKNLYEVCISGGGMAVLLFFVGQIGVNPFVKTVLIGVSGVFAYLFLLVLFRNKMFASVLKSLQSRLIS